MAKTSQNLLSHYANINVKAVWRRFLRIFGFSVCRRFYKDYYRL